MVMENGHRPWTQLALGWNRGVGLHLIFFEVAMGDMLKIAWMPGSLFIMNFKYSVQISVHVN